MPVHRHGRTCRASPPFFRLFSVPPVVTVFTLWKALRLRNVPFFSYLLPGSRLAESCFRSVGLFPPGWNGSCHSWRFSGESLGRLFGRLVLPDSRALGAGLPGLPGSCPVELLPPSCSGRAATAAAPAHHTLCRPCFPRKLGLCGC